MHAGSALALLLITAQAAPPQTPVVRERVAVSRVLLDARVVGRGGDPVLGLTADDFVVRVDGVRARVEAADWVGGGAADRRELSTAEGRLVLLLFQRYGEFSRTEGLMKIAPMVGRLVEGLDPRDWVAVATFDSHLHLHTDFTRDHARVAEIVRRDVVMGDRPRPPAQGPGPSLMERLDAHAMRKAYNIETALRLLAVAMEPLPGPKSVAYFCTGMGRLSGLGIRQHRDFDPAVASLVRGRTAVFSLDLVQADRHSLQQPLRILAESTGGFYDKTYVLPAGDVRRLGSALDGHYVLAIESPVPSGGTHRVEVVLARGLPGTVHARGTFAD